MDKKTIVDFFSQFGVIRHCKIKKNSKTGRSLGYAYITFEDEQSTKQILNTQVEFCGRICECKPVFKKDELKEEINREKKKKMLIYEMDIGATNNDLKGLFESLTSISHAYVVKDPDNDLNIGYGYVVFNSEKELEDFCSKKHNLSLNGKQIKYTNRFHVPPKKNSKESKVSASNYGGEPVNGQTSQFDGSNNKGLLESSKGSSQLNRIQNCESAQLLNANSQQGVKQLVKLNASIQPASARGAEISQSSSSKIFPKQSRLQLAFNQKVSHIYSELEMSNQGQFLAFRNNVHGSFTKPQTEKDQTGLTESTKESRVIQQIPSKQTAKKSPKYKLTSTMRDILRASPYLGQSRENYRLNRDSNQLN